MFYNLNGFQDIHISSYIYGNPHNKALRTFSSATDKKYYLAKMHIIFVPTRGFSRVEKA